VVTSPSAATIPTTATSCGATAPIPGVAPLVARTEPIRLRPKTSATARPAPLTQLQPDAGEQHAGRGGPDQTDRVGGDPGRQRQRLGRSCASWRRSPQVGGGGGGSASLGGCRSLTVDSEESGGAGQSSGRRPKISAPWLLRSPPRHLWVCGAPGADPRAARRRGRGDRCESPLPGCMQECATANRAAPYLRLVESVGPFSARWRVVRMSSAVGRSSRHAPHRRCPRPSMPSTSTRGMGSRR
jgi:hypothetical protein